MAASAAALLIEPVVLVDDADADAGLRVSRGRHQRCRARPWRSGGTGRCRGPALWRAASRRTWRWGVRCATRSSWCCSTPAGRW